MSSRSVTRSARTKRIGLLYNLLGFLVAFDQLKPGKPPSAMGSKIAEILQPKNLHLQNYGSRMQFSSYAKTWKNKDAMLEHGQTEALIKRISDPDRLAWFLFGYTKKDIEKLGKRNVDSDVDKMIKSLKIKAVNGQIIQHHRRINDLSPHRHPSAPPTQLPTVNELRTLEEQLQNQLNKKTRRNQRMSVSRRANQSLRSVKRSLRNSTRNAKSRSMHRQSHH
jgi:hypothetical protein